ncbi:5'-3' exonuclease [Desertibacillus haloalkaliphilus]|uniref:5'-3' exonuclease n=1 Tax=Desertibacillus haloalkaliphilus TaxID=1328930 RepID=UPI001C2630CD|nr:5'-3' exonuclease H3TH domain-containing protein [Desertibacillus haloalkaliphilus]
MNSAKNNKESKLLLIDGSNLLAKGYFATSWRGDLKPNSNGIYTNGVNVFMKSLFRLIRQYKPTHVITCWDTDSKTTFRKQMYPEYKAGRQLDEELGQQFPLCETLLKAMNVPYFSHEKWEADDYIGTLATQWKEHHDGEVLIASSDKDLFQLLDDRTHQLFKRQGKEELLFTAADFQKQYGIETSQWLIAKAILGDKSDNIPGIKGVGEKFLPALAEYKIFNLEDLYKDDVIEALNDSSYKRYVKKIQGSKEVAELSYELSKIVCDIEGGQVDFDDLSLQIDKSAMEDQFEELELTKLIGQF